MRTYGSFRKRVHSNQRHDMAPEDLPIFTGTTPKLGFLDSHEPRNHTGEKREGRGERGEEKRTAGTHNFYIAYFGDSF